MRVKRFRVGTTVLTRSRKTAAACNGRLSITSPPARALVGKTIGDAVEASTPKGGKSYEIIEVSFITVSRE